MDEETRNKRYRNFNVQVVANGFIVTIGCQTLVYKTLSEIAVAIMAYEKDPEGVEKDVLNRSLVPGLEPQSVYSSATIGYNTVPTPLVGLREAVQQAQAARL